MSTQTLYPTLRYRDTDAGLRWMLEVLGGEEVVVYRDDEGAIVHGEVRVAGGVVMFGPERHGEGPLQRAAGSGSLYAAVDDPDALHARAAAAGGEVVMGLHDTDYGSRDFSLRDPAGNLWSFGTYRP